MNNRKDKAMLSTLFLVSLTPGVANAQQLYPPKSEASSSPTESNNSLTGGAGELRPTRARPALCEWMQRKKNSLSGSSSSGNRLTGGAEGSPTEQDAGSPSGVKRPNNSTRIDR